MGISDLLVDKSGNMFDFRGNTISHNTTVQFILHVSTHKPYCC